MEGNKEKTRRLLSQEAEGINKLSSNVLEREQINMNKVVGKVPSKVGRIPIKMKGTDIEGNDLKLSFHTEGAPIANDQTRVKVNERNITSVSVKSRIFPYIYGNFRRSPYISVNFRKFPCISVNPRKSQYIPVNPRNGTAGVLTDRPPGTVL